MSPVVVRRCYPGRCGGRPVLRCEMVCRIQRRRHAPRSLFPGPAAPPVLATNRTAVHDRRRQHAPGRRIPLGCGPRLRRGSAHLTRPSVPQRRPAQPRCSDRRHHRSHPPRPPGLNASARRSPQRASTSRRAVLRSAPAGHPGTTSMSPLAISSDNAGGSSACPARAGQGRAALRGVRARTYTVVVGAIVTVSSGRVGSRAGRLAFTPTHGPTGPLPAALWPGSPPNRHPTGPRDTQLRWVPATQPVG